jgi:hypothetical protein
MISLAQKYRVCQAKNVIEPLHGYWGDILLKNRLDDSFFVLVRYIYHGNLFSGNPWKQHD